MSEIGLTPYFDCDNAQENIIFALRKALVVDSSGNVGFRVFSTGEDIIPAADVTGDQLIGTVPDGYMLEIVKFTNNGGQCFISLGTTPGNNDITDNMEIAALDSQTLQLNYDPGATFNVYLTVVVGPVDLDVYLLIRKSES